MTNQPTDPKRALEYLCNAAIRALPLADLETYKAAVACLLALIEPPPAEEPKP